MPTAPAFERLWNHAPFAVDFLDGSGDDLVISFSSIGHDVRRPPSPEFVGSASGGGQRRALFVMDASRSWATDAGFAPALLAAMQEVTRRRPVARLVTMGLSMGAFSALVAAQVLPVDAVLAFGPQWSPTLPGESRWAEWTNRFAGVSPPASPSPTEGEGKRPPHWPCAPLPQTGWTCLFHGLADDRQQALAFPPVKGVDHLLFPDLTHAGLLPHLKAQGVLHGLVAAALAGDRRRLLRIATGAGAYRRDWPPPQ